MDYIERHEYDACRSRCTDRCGACQEGIKEAKLTCDKRYDNMINDINELKIGMSVNNFKWGLQAFIGSFIASVLVIVLAAVLIMHFGIAQPQIMIDDKKTSIIIPYKAPQVSSWAYAGEVAKK